MAITFRANKGQALTYSEMDTNLGSYFYSSSINGTILTLHYTGSTAVPVDKQDHDIQLLSNISITGTENRIVKFGSGGSLAGQAGFITDTAGNVGINIDESTDLPLTYNLEVSGSIRASQGVLTNSDERLKDNIETIDGGLERVQELRGVSFNWTNQEDKTLGFIAQEIKEVLPEVVKEDNKGFYQVDYSAVVPVLVEAIKDLKAEIEELKNK
jgi:hypothetical protein